MTCLLTAVTAAVQVLAYLDGSAAPITLDATLELSPPDLVPRVRRWTPHPECGCLQRRGRPSGENDPLARSRVRPRRLRAAAGAGRGADDQAIAMAVISLGHKLNLRVIAEGVETEQQRAFLSANDCDEMQGYLFSPPVPAERIAAMLAQQPGAGELP